MWFGPGEINFLGKTHQWLWQHAQLQDNLPTFLDEKEYRFDGYQAYQSLLVSSHLRLKSTIVQKLTIALSTKIEYLTELELFQSNHRPLHGETECHRHESFQASGGVLHRLVWH